jgi:carbon monoxide dehydrogenase subunit G
VINVQRTFTVEQPVDVVIDYLKDFSHAEQWDPGTKSCVQESAGPVEVGTTWHNVSVVKGKETELSYRLAELRPGFIKFVGENKTATSTDNMTITANGSGSSITYQAQIEFHGLAKLATPFLQSEFEGLGDETAEKITTAINSL